MIKIIYMKTKNIKHFVLIVLCYYAVYGLNSMLKLDVSLYTFSNSIFSVLTYLVLLSLAKKIDFNEYSIRALKILFPLSFLFSIWMVLGSNIIQTGFSSIDKIDTWFSIIGGLIFWEIILINIFIHCGKHNNIFIEKNQYYKISYKKIIKIFCIIYIAWIPVLIASYPGIYGYDSVYQTSFYLNHSLSLKHPLIHTLFLGFCIITLGQNIFHNLQLGMLIYSLIQMSVSALTFSIIYCYLRKIAISRWICYFLLGFYMFFPTNPIMAISSTKDVLFADFTALLITCTCWICLNKESLLTWKYKFMFIGCSFLFLALRSQAIYVYVFSMIVGLFSFNGHYRKVLMKLIICSLFVYFIYNGPVTAKLGGIKSDSIPEMMSVPVMQLGRSATNPSNNLSQKDIDQIKAYVPDYQLYIQNTRAISDPLKKTFNSKLFREKPLGFVKLWIETGIKCPVDYCDAFFRLTVGLWYPDMNERDPEAYHPYWEYKSTTPIDSSWIIPQRTTPESFQWLAKVLDHITYNNTYQFIPLISTLFSGAFAVWIILLCLVYSICIKNFRVLFPISIVLILWLTLLLGPVVLYRYVYPIIVSVPIIVSTVARANFREVIWTKSQF